MSSTPETTEQPTSLCDRIAAALHAHDWPQPGGPWAHATPTDRAGCLGLADAALSALLAPHTPELSWQGRAEHATQLYARTAVELEDTQREAERFKADYLKACGTIAALYEAATGRTGEGPVRGVVEDVADVRTELEQLRARVSRLSGDNQLTPEQPYPPHTDYAVEVLADDGEWVGVSYRRRDIETARRIRDRYRARYYPDGERMRIVRWTDTATVVEIDPEPEQQPAEQFIAHMAAQDPERLEADRAAAWGREPEQPS